MNKHSASVLVVPAEPVASRFDPSRNCPFDEHTQRDEYMAWLAGFTTGAAAVHAIMEKYA